MDLTGLFDMEKIRGLGSRYLFSGVGFNIVHGELNIRGAESSVTDSDAIVTARLSVMLRIQTSPSYFEGWFTVVAA